MSAVTRTALIGAILWLGMGLSLVRGQGTPAPTAAFAAGFQAVIHVGGQVPAAELADRFGPSNTVGLGAYRLTESGWRWGVQYRFQTGAEVREEGLLDNLRNASGYIIDNEGSIALVTAQQRGTMLSVSAGRIVPAAFLPKGSGFLFEVQAGFWEHKVHYQNRGNRVTQLEDPYLKGYDRLTGGLVALPRLGYVHDAPNGLVRFQCGLEGWFGRMQPNRVWNADTMTADTGPRADRAVGIFAAWILRLQARSTNIDYYH